MKSTAVSVVVPHYNHLDYLSDRLTNILSQTLSDIEVILLDDATPGFSRAVVPPDKRIKVVLVNEVNSGSTFRQWARGIAHCKADYIWIAESDDLAEPFFLQKAIEALNIYPASEFFFCETRRLNSRGQVLPSPCVDVMLSDLKVDSFGFKSVPGSIFWRLLDDFNIISNVSACLFRREALNSVIKGLESFKYLGDWFTYLNFTQCEAVIFAPELFNYQRTNTSNISFSEFSKEKGLRLLEEYEKIFSLQLNLRLIGFEDYSFKIFKKSKQIYKYMNLEIRLRFTKLPPGEFVVSIFGAGAFGRQVLKVLRSLNITVLYVIDRIGNSVLSADGFEDIPLITLEEFSRKPLPDGHKIIIASVAFEDDMRQELRHYDLQGSVLEF